MAEGRLDLVWVLTCTALIFMMQVGFLCLESGLTRSKNAINVAIKNVSDFAIAIVLFWLIGFGLMFGDSWAGLIGASGFPPALSTAEPKHVAFFVFEAMFCATAATIVSGAVAERMQFWGYLVVSALVTAMVYPVFGHWAWGGLATGLPGWLEQWGFVDFAGATVVHSVGGWVALAAVLVIGPRMGRFPVGGPPREILGSNIPLAMGGVLLLFFGWFGFNGGSTLGFDQRVPLIIVNTLLAAAGGFLSALAAGWRLKRHPEVMLAANGLLAGLVAVTAGAHAVTPAAALLIGAVSGLLLVAATEQLLAWRIDDAVGAIPVHLVGGIWGTLAVGLFGAGEALGSGLGRWQQVEVQLIGIVICFAWTFPLVYLLLRVLNRIKPLRVGPEAEASGLNVSEHKVRTELIDLLHAMEQQAQNLDLASRVPEEPFTEVGQIARQYNRVMAALERTIARSEVIVRDIVDGIVTFSERGLITSVNPAAAQLFGVAAAAAVGQPLTQLLRSPDGDGVPPADWFQQRLNQPSEWRVPRPDGSAVELELTVSRGHIGEDCVYTAVAHDLGARKRVEEALHRARELAEGANQAKTAFLSSMSHEIRTPLNAILGYAQLLRRDAGLAPAQQELLRPLEQSGQHLLGLINDILDLSKIEAGAMELLAEDFALDQLLSELALMFAPRCAERGIRWRLDVPPGAVAVHGDAGKLRQVLINLLGNAVKFTTQGAVSLSAQRLDDGRLRFEVQDSGPGISTEDRERIFKAFAQTRTGQRHGGTGLGLAIAARQVELMSGQLQVDDVQPHGCRFSFVLPLPAASQAPQRDDRGGEIRQVPGSAPVRALVVDDIEANRDVLARMLRSLGVAVVEAGDGREAITRLYEQVFDLVLMDIHMPVMDGLEALSYIQRHFPTPPRCVAVTASALLHEREEHRRVGFDGLIVKPFTFEQLCQCLRQQLPGRFDVLSDADHDGAEAAPLIAPAATAAVPPPLPDALRQRLMQALDSCWLSGIQAVLEQWAAQDPSASAYCSELRDYLQRFDFDGLKRELIRSNPDLPGAPI